MGSPMTPQELVCWSCLESGWQNKCENGRADATLAKETNKIAKPIVFATTYTSMIKGDPIIGSLSVMSPLTNVYFNNLRLRQMPCNQPKARAGPPYPPQCPDVALLHVQYFPSIGEPSVKFHG